MAKIALALPLVILLFAVGTILSKPLESSTDSPNTSLTNHDLGKPNRYPADLPKEDSDNTGGVVPLRAPCPRQFDPVCGSDFKTYTNPCEFKNGQAADSSLTLLHKGPCDQ